MLLLLLKDSHKLLGLLRFEVLENLKEKHKKNFYNRANKRKQKKGISEEDFKSTKKPNRKKREGNKRLLSPYPSRAGEIYPASIGNGDFGREDYRPFKKSTQDFEKRQTFSNIVILLFSNIETLISMSSEPESSKSLWMTTQLTLPSCLERVCMGNMVSRFQTLNKRQPWERSRTVSRPSIQLRFKNELAFHYGFPSYACAAYRHSIAIQT